MRERKFKLRIWLVLAVAAVALGLVAAAQATTSIVAPTWPIPADAPAGPPPIPSLPTAGNASPPADKIADPVTPAAACGGWEVQSKYGGRWPAGSSWWEYRCSYGDSQFHDPECDGGGGACNAWCQYCYWETREWADYFYWDGSNAVFYGQSYTYSVDDVNGYSSSSSWWWDAPAAQWYVSPPPPPVTLVASFDFNCTRLTCNFSAGASWARDGIAGYGWDFGDGTSASGVNAQHTYAAKGTYKVTLTVTDTGGRSATSTQTVSITELPPTASFTFTCAGLTCTFDASASTDDGTIQSYEWDFGDGDRATGSSAQNRYAQSGSYGVRLRVFDDKGLEDSTWQAVNVVGVSTNAPPTAAFAYSCVGLTCRFDASGSSDSDGRIVAYQWMLGDYTGVGTAESMIEHTYREAGTYAVTLKVIDDDKASTITEPRKVTVTNVAPTATFTFSCSSRTCTFDGSKSVDSDGTINSYWWDFGDGTALEVGMTAEHTYDRDGVYGVTLRVIDNGGIVAAASKTISVG
jgi:PKD repeat protein